MIKRFYVLALILLFFAFGCGKNPVKHDSENSSGFSKVIIYLKDMNGKPISGDYFNVDLEVKQGDSIKYVHYYAPTDENGIAEVDSLAAGTYKIDYYYNLDWRNDNYYQISYHKEVALEHNQTLEIKINIPSNGRVNTSSVITFINLSPSTFSFPRISITIEFRT